MLERDDVRGRLHPLTRKHHTAFAAACCERMVPNYKAFVLTDTLGHYTIRHYQHLCEILDEIWDNIARNSANKSISDHVAKRLGDLAPTLDNTSSIWMMLALIAIDAVQLAANSFLDDSEEAAYRAALCAYDSISEYLSIVATPFPRSPGTHLDRSDWIDRSPLLAAERQAQLWQIDFIEMHPALDGWWLGELRESSRDGGIDLIRRRVVADHPHH